MTESGFLFRRVAILGIGLIGSSVARALRTYGGAELIVCGDANLAHVEQALELDLVDEATSRCDLAVRGADLVVLCVPVGAMASLAAQIAPHLTAGCIVTDVGSVKGSVMADVGAVLPSTVSFIPGHPIAGAEESGPDAGYAELFQDRWWILTPPADVAPEALQRLTAVLTLFGARVKAMEPAQHDRVLAAISHLPQMVSSTVMTAAADCEDLFRHEILCYAAGGFRDVTRLAASDPVMWRDVFLNNRAAALDVIDAFMKNLTEVREAVDAGDAAMLERFFARAQKLKKG